MSEAGSGGIGCASPALLLKREAVAVQSHPETGSEEACELPPIAQHQAPIKPRDLTSRSPQVNSYRASHLTQEVLANIQDTHLLFLTADRSFLILCSPLQGFTHTAQ